MNPNINIQSKTILVKHPTIIIPAEILGLPSALIEWFKEKERRFTTVPNNIIFIYDFAYIKVFSLAPNNVSILFANNIPSIIMIIPVITDNVIAFPISFLASSTLPCPSFIDMVVVVPIPINIPNASIIVIIGIVTPRPVIASGPTPGIFPIKILSTTLYKLFTNIPIIAGIEYFSSNLLIRSVPNNC
ncbi:Uncharacterised protein [Clostridioides difficile]|nr:Uncharacterised protein [Clostridioides difficile]